MLGLSLKILQLQIKFKKILDNKIIISRNLTPQG